MSLVYWMLLGLGSMLNFASLSIHSCSTNIIIMMCCPFPGRSISTAISAGSALAFTSAVIDAGGQTTRIDNGKEYYPYTTKKRHASDS